MTGQVGRAFVKAGRWARWAADVRVGAFVGLLVPPLERPPRVELVPEVVEALDLLLGAGVVSELGNGLSLGEPTLSLEDGAESGDVLSGGDRNGVGDGVLDLPVNRVELSPSIKAGERLVGCRDGQRAHSVSDRIEGSRE